MDGNLVEQVSGSLDPVQMGQVKPGVVGQPGEDDLGVRVGALDRVVCGLQQRGVAPGVLICRPEGENRRLIPDLP